MKKNIKINNDEINIDDANANANAMADAMADVS